MKVEYIQPFIQSIESIITTFCHSKPKIGKIRLRPSGFIIEDVSVIIGFVGNIKGQAFFVMDSDFAKNIASVLMGMEVAELDDFAKSAVGELGNMIMGNACTSLSEKSIEINITPPTIISGEKIYVSNLLPTFTFDIDVEDVGRMGFDITIADK